MRQPYTLHSESERERGSTHGLNQVVTFENQMSLLMIAFIVNNEELTNKVQCQGSDLVLLFKISNLL